MGLNKYEIHTDNGVSKLAVHYYNCKFLSIISLNQDNKGFLLKYAYFSHIGGILFNINAVVKFSIISVIFKAPISPNLSDSKLYLISKSKIFILSHSYIATTTYGVLSFILAVISNILKSGGALLLRSITIPMIPESFLPPEDPPP